MDGFPFAESNGAAITLHRMRLLTHQVHLNTSFAWVVKRSVGKKRGLKLCIQ